MKRSGINGKSMPAGMAGFFKRGGGKVPREIIPVELRPWPVYPFRFLIAFVFIALTPLSLEAQFRWTAQFAGETSFVSIGSMDTVWHQETLTVGFVDPDEGGISAWAEQRMRGSRRDIVIGATAYRRLGDWTIGGGASAAPDPEFWYRSEVNGELSRRIIGTFVLSTAYKFIDFPSVRIHQVQPALTWYNPRGEVQVRWFITHNPTLGGTSGTVLVRSLVRLHRRLDATIVFACGDRIFDIASLQYGTARSWIGRLGLGINLFPKDSIEIAGGYARENPDFEQKTIAFSYRRTF
jgi:YaiO family outer membrane protein